MNRDFQTASATKPASQRVGGGVKALKSSKGKKRSAGPVARI